MRLDSWNIESFGTLKGFSAKGLADKNLIIVEGGNESGKSTLVEFLTTTLFGFSPSRRDAHPYAPWSGEALAGSAEFVLDEGGRAQVTRRLDSRCSGNLVTDEGPKDIVNEPLDWTGSVDRNTYRRLHSLALDTLNGADDETWRLLEQRLLAAARQDDLAAARDVIPQMMAQAGELWRPDAEARTRHRPFAKALQRLHRRRIEADARARRVLELNHTLQGRTWQIRQAADELTDLRSRLRRAEVLLPVLTTLERIEALRAEADEILPVDEAGDDPRGRLRLLTERLATQTQTAKDLSRRIEDDESASDIPDEHDDVLAVEDEVRALVGQSSVHQQDLAHLNDLDRARDSNEVLLNERVGSVIEGTLDDDIRKALFDLDLDALQSHVKAWDEARRRPEVAAEQLNLAKESVEVARKDLDELPSSDDERVLRQRAEDLRTLQSRDAVLTEMKKELEAVEKGTKPDTSSDKERKRLAWGLMLSGVILGVVLFAGNVTDSMLVGFLAAALVASGVMVLKRDGSGTDKPDIRRIKLLESQCRKLRARLDLHEYETVDQKLKECDEAQTLSAARPTLERRLVAARNRVVEAERACKACETTVEDERQAVANAFPGIPMAARRLESPGQDLVGDIQSIRSMLRDITRNEGEREAIAKRAGQRDERARALADRLGIVPTGHPMDIAPLCQERLHLALASRQRAKQASDELPRLRERLTTIEAELVDDAAECDALGKIIGALDPDGSDPQAGLARIESARAVRQEARTLEQQLHTDHPDWAERSEEARAAREAGLELDLPSEQRLDLSHRIAEFETAHQRLLSEQLELQEELANLERLPGLSDVDGEIAAWRDEERRLLARRDRLALMAGVVRAADDLWVREHQPAVLGRASQHLNAITGGRYQRLHVDERRLFVHRSDLEQPVPLDEAPLSRAARDRIHLALRVAMAEHLDGRQHLPLILDEVFIHWDDRHVEHCLRWIQELSAERQVLMLTSVTDFAERLVKEAGAHRINTPKQPRGKAPKPPTPQTQKPAKTPA